MSQIVLINQSEAFRHQISNKLDTYSAIQNIEIQNPKEVCAFLQEHTAGILVMEISNDYFDTHVLCKKLKRKYSKIKFLIIYNDGNKETIPILLKQGAHGFIHQKNTDSLFSVACQKLLNNTRYCDQVQLLIPATNNVTNLTMGELNILKHIGKGKTSKEIAVLRLCSTATVEKHRKNIVKKLATSGRDQLIRFAIKNRQLVERY